MEGVARRFDCSLCKRRGQSKLARLAEKYGAEITLDDLLNRIAWTCPHPRGPDGWRKRPRKYTAVCGIRLPDWETPTPRPPDTPGPTLRWVGDSEEENAA